MKIGVVLPTRGMVFTAVEQAIEGFRKDYDITVYRSHNLPIPEGHNQLTNTALSNKSDYIWFIEEDTVPTARSLERLIQANSDISCIDYGVSGWGCVTKNEHGEILWCGLGCTLVKRSVFEKLTTPYFRVDMSLRLNDSQWVKLPQNYIETKQYGSLDIWFCCQARKKGFKIVQVEDECDHLELVGLGTRESNHGLHEIRLKPKIEKKQILKEVNL